MCGPHLPVVRNPAGPLFRSRAALQAEILVLRHQLNILRRRSPKRVVLGKFDHLVFCGSLSLVSHGAECAKDSPAGDRYPLASRWFPSLLALEITTAWRPGRGSPRTFATSFAR